MSDWNIGIGYLKINFMTAHFGKSSTTPCTILNKQVEPCKDTCRVNFMCVLVVV